MGVVSEVTRMARGWLAVSNPGYESIISMVVLSTTFVISSDKEIAFPAFM